MTSNCAIQSNTNGSIVSNYAESDVRSSLFKLALVERYWLVYRMSNGLGADHPVMNCEVWEPPDIGPIGLWLLRVKMQLRCNSRLLFYGFSSIPISRPREMEYYRYSAFLKCKWMLETASRVCRTYLAESIWKTRSPGESVFNVSVDYGDWRILYMMLH